MNWDAIRYFLSVAKQGGLTAASRDMNVSISTVSRNLSQLEDDMGIPLFVRHATGYTLTEQGESLFRKAEEAEDAILSFESMAIEQHKSASGEVRLSTAENIATHFIIPALPNFYRRYPLISLDLATSIPVTNIAKREADIALRLARPEHGNVLVRKLGIQQWGFYHGKQLEWNEDGPLSRENAANYPFVFWADDLSDLPVPKWLLNEIKPASTPVRCSTLYSVYSAARAGVGIALLPCFMGDTDATLERLPYEDEVIAQDLWLAVNRDVRSSARVSAVVDFLIQVVNENRALLEGDYLK